VEILIEPFLRRAQQRHLSLHLRFRQAPPPPANGVEGGSGLSRARARVSGGMSCVIIYRPYEYLEPAVRELFRHAADVEVIVDRRWRDRRREPAGAYERERRLGDDRRASVPMLDVLISLGA
jgi:hypothetical protein